MTYERQGGAGYFLKTQYQTMISINTRHALLAVVFSFPKILTSTKLMDLPKKGLALGRLTEGLE